MRGSIRRRGTSWELRVYLGRDPVTGHQRYASRSVQGSRRGAEHVLRDMVAAAEAGVTHRAGATFGELCEAWLAAASGHLAANTVTETRRILDRVLLPALGDVALAALRPEHLAELYRRLLRNGRRGGRPLAAGTVRRVHGVARRALTVGMRWGWLVANPAFVVEPPSACARPILPPSPADVRRLLAAARAVDPVLACFLFVAAATGARRGELCGLRWRDIDPAAGQLDIVRTIIIVEGAWVEAPTKTRQSRRIALDDAVGDVLAAHRRSAEGRAAEAGVELDREGFVFSRDADGRRPWRPDAVTRAFDRVRRQAGLAGVRLHDLRHFTATALLSSGVDLRTVAGRLGHSKASTTLNVYAAFDPTADRLAAQTITRLLIPPDGPDGNATRSPGQDPGRDQAHGPRRGGAIVPARAGDVLPTGEARARLSRIATGFEREGALAPPVVFGSHRRPQGVILAWELWRKIEDRLDAFTSSGRSGWSPEDRDASDGSPGGDAAVGATRRSDSARGQRSRACDQDPTSRREVRQGTRAASVRPLLLVEEADG